MTDPKRWSDDADELGPDEQRLFRAGLEPRVPRGAKHAVWVALAAQLPATVAAATTVGAAGSGAAKLVTTASLLKAAGMGAVLAATAITAVTVVERRLEPPARPAEPPRALASASAPRETPRSVEARSPTAPLPSAPPPVAPSSAASSAERVRVPAELAPALRAAPSVASFPDEAAPTQHDIESRTIAAARSLLRAGQPRGALGVLEQARHDFPNGELSQERDALAIEALRAVGDAAEARRRATEFLARYPASPHAPMVRRALE